MSFLNHYTFSVPERNRKEIALLRWALVIIFIWLGAMKFTSYEATGVAPLIQHSPILAWLGIFGTQGQSNIIGLFEIITAVLLAIGAFHAYASALGSLLSTIIFCITLTFFLSTPGVSAHLAGGFPIITGSTGQFLLKDLVLLAASLVLLLGSAHRTK